MPNNAKTLLFVTGLVLCEIVLAYENHMGSIEEIVVYGRAEEQIGVAIAASSGQVADADIQLASRLRVGELVEVVPGMVATQHSGTGKANQYYLRGFNLDHGTDFSAHAHGMPLNMRTHGHGQGYLDLNFLIPEMVSTTKFRKGPYHASVGDFSSAGSVEFLFYDELSDTILASTFGQDAYRRILVAGSKNLGSGILTGALDITGYDGPWQQPENLKQDKFQLRSVFPLGNAQLHLDLQAYVSQWDSTDQIPARAVRSHYLDELGFIDPDLGGSTDRISLAAGIDLPSWSIKAYAVDYDFMLYSNFTYFLDDPIAGDEFGQRDSRRIYGVNLEGSIDQSTDPMVAIRWGVQLRMDKIDELGLYRTQARRRHDTIRTDSVDELSIGVFSEVELKLTERLRATIGLRGDHFDWDVDALQLENGGAGSESLFSPKISLAYRVSNTVEGYANWGAGFHSNDVRGTTIATDPATGERIEPSDALVATRGAELGIRVERRDGFNAALVGFWLQVDSELVFVGDAGGTQATNGSARSGVEASLFWQVTDWLALDANYTFTDAAFDHTRREGNAIPGAIESTGSLGLSAVWSNGLTSHIRARYLGRAPLVEDRSIQSESSILVNAGIGYRFNSVDLRVDVFNLFDSNKHDISYFYASRLPGEQLEGVQDVHFHPLEPRTVRATLTWRPDQDSNRGPAP